MNPLLLLSKLISIVALLSIFISCEKEIERPDSSYQFQSIIVESILTNENQLQKIAISRPSSKQNQKKLPISGAAIVISTENHEYAFSESSTERGNYFSLEKFAASVNQEYHLQIEFEGKKYEATTGIEAVSNYNPIEIEAYTDTNYRFALPTYSYNPSEQAMYKLNVSWFSDTLVKLTSYRYQLNSLDVSIVFSPEEESLLFPAGSIIIGKKYSLTNDYAEYLRALLAETHWQGGLFDDEKANLPTNISNGGLGYFTACSVKFDTLLVE